VTVDLPGVIEDVEHLNKNSQTLAEILTHYLQNVNLTVKNVNLTVKNVTILY